MHQQTQCDTNVGRDAVTRLTPHRRAVFLSDVHLGSRHCHAAELARFLTGLRCVRLYLVGDIIDLWWMAHRRATWRPAHGEVIQALHALRAAGTEIIYIPGNHDASLRKVCGLMLPAMQVRRRAIHVTADGRRLLVAHGDDYDGVTHFGGLQEQFGDWLYYRILTGNHLLNAVRRRLGWRYWSLSEFLKKRSSAAERYIERFVQAWKSLPAAQQVSRWTLFGPPHRQCGRQRTTTYSVAKTRHEQPSRAPASQVPPSVRPRRKPARCGTRRRRRVRRARERMLCATL